MAPGAPLRLGFLMFPGFPMACLTSAIEPLRAANEITGRQEFVWRLLAESRAPVRCSAAIGFDPDEVLAECSALDHLYLLSPPTAEFADARRGPARLRWLDRTGTTLGAFSGGIFPLAAAGLMAGRGCSVHWCYDAAFRAAYPDVQASDATVLRDGRRNTASGAAAVFDLMLRLIEERLGRACMTEVACWFQHPFPRDPGVGQTVPVPGLGSSAEMLPPPVRQALALFDSHVEDTLRIPDVAQAVGLSQRQFERVFKAATGQSPLRHYRHLRLRRVRQRVLYSGDSLRDIASAAGFAGVQRMTRHYAELFGLTPGDDRRRMALAGRAAPVRLAAE